MQLNNVAKYKPFITCPLAFKTMSIRSETWSNVLTSDQGITVDPQHLENIEKIIDHEPSGIKVPYSPKL